MCRNFWAAREEAVHGDNPNLLLALDCNKGSNAWIAAGFKDASVRHRSRILAFVDCLLVNMPVLILDGVEFAPLRLAPGLTQGCPASCMLYTIGIDPLLSSLQQTPRFVDDRSMGCKSMLALSAVSNLILSFEQASGQKKKSIVENLQ